MDTTNWQDQEHAMQIRTRGPVRTRGTVAATRTRGSVRTRGAGSVTTQPLAQLVAGIRAKAYGSPSAVVIHGWDGPPAQHFLAHLATLLDSDDAIWLVATAAAQAPEPPPAWPEAVVLDFIQEVDRRTYANLVVDVVFFPTATPGVVQQWYGRTEAVILTTPIEAAAVLLEGAQHDFPELYCWSAAEPEVLVSL